MAACETSCTPRVAPVGSRQQGRRRPALQPHRLPGGTHTRAGESAAPHERSHGRMTTPLGAVTHALTVGSSACTPCVGALYSEYAPFVRCVLTSFVDVSSSPACHPRPPPAR
eukprot:2587869-Prymnesium_polylepis.2